MWLYNSMNTSAVNFLSFYHTVRWYCIVEVGKKSYGFMDFHTLKNGLAIRFTRKNHLECISTAVPWLNEAKS